MKNALVFILIMIISITQFSGKSARAADKKRVAILEIEAKNAPKTYADIIRDIMEVSFHKSGAFHVLERNQMSLILKEQGFSMSGCIDTSCAVQIGKILSADMVAVGTLYKINKYAISIKLVDVSKGDIILADSESADTEDDIEDAVNRLAERIAENIDNENTWTRPASEPEQKPVIKEKAEEKKPAEPPFEFPSIDLWIFAQGAYFMPFGIFKDVVKPGVGGTAGLSIEVFLPGLMIGCESGYFTFKGKTRVTDSFTMIPVLGSIGYRRALPASLFVSISAQAGSSYNTISYDKRGDVYPAKQEYEKKMQWETTYKGGIRFGYSIIDNLDVYIGADYGIIQEKSRMLKFAIFSAGVGVKL